MSLFQTHVELFPKKLQISWQLCSRIMVDTLKVIIYIKDVVKPIVFTCKETKEEVLNRFNQLSECELNTIYFDSGDFFMCRKSDIRAVTITTEKLNHDD